MNRERALVLKHITCVCCGESPVYLDMCTSCESVLGDCGEVGGLPYVITADSLTMPLKAKGTNDCPSCGALVLTTIEKTREMEKRFASLLHGSFQLEWIQI